MNMMGNFKDKTNGNKVTAIGLPANKNIGETDEESCVVTFPASDKERMSATAYSETGLWSVEGFKERFQKL